MKKKLFSILVLFYLRPVYSQELFTYTEPASNMAAKSIGIRLNNTFMKAPSSSYEYHLVPEIMFGLSKKIMLHGEGFFSNRNSSFNAEGAAVYLKYRFFSKDDVHSHFRLATFAKMAVNNSNIHQPAIDLNGYNSGMEAGIIATKLINKIALSTGSSMLHALNNNANKFGYNNKSRNAFAFNFSIGKLLLPKEYTSYRQVNLNAMIEILGQVNAYTGKSFTDVASSFQFIINSKTRVDTGYRFALIKDLQRTAASGFFLRLEYNLFNAYK